MPAAMGEYHFVCRNAPEFPLAELVDQVNEQLDALCTLTYSPEELNYLAGLYYLKPDFIDFLSLFRFQRRFIEAKADGDKLRVIARGPIIHVMGFEIPVLSIVNQCYFSELRRRTGVDPTAEGRARLANKVAAIKRFEGAPRLRFPLEIFDFGLRRRYSGEWQREVVATLKAEVPAVFRGTSNVKLAMDLSLTPIGSQAHEWFQMHQATGVRLVDSQKAALENWVQEYRGDLGIALTDVVGIDALLRDFDRYFSKLFDGVRHDSGDPFVWGEKMIAHYQSLRIPPDTKRLVFSDGLTLAKSFDLYNTFADRAPVGFGIGTHLTNDLGPTPLNIVMKLMRCNGQPVAKLSDTPGKTLCDDADFVRYLAKTFNHPSYAA